MSFNRSKLDWLPGLASALSIATCYGTLVAVTILSTLGIAIAIDERIWAGAIVAFAALAVAGIALGSWRHRYPWPLLLALTGAGAIAYAMYGQYDRLIELSGFALLCLAAFWDWRLRRTAKP